MSFSPDTVNKAWDRAKGKCERCSKTLVKTNRGREGEGAWETHHRDGDSNNNNLSNCEILCWSCHKKTRNFGG